jgi:hypothetical protein
MAKVDVVPLNNEMSLVGGESGSRSRRQVSLPIADLGVERTQRSGNDT